MKNKNLVEKKGLIAILMIFAVILSACTSNQNGSNSENEQKVCTMDAKICADGSAVGRNPENGCQFDPCPEDLGGSGGETSGKIDAKYRNYAANSIEECTATTFICDVEGTKAFFDQSGCGCEAVDPKIYTSQNLDDCSRIKFMCIQNHVPFTDEIGCGCEFSWEQVLSGTGNSPSEPEKTYCEDIQRGEDIACTMEYNPVCGWFSQTIQCIKYPCAQTFGNGCGACANPDVQYYTPGECPTE